MAVKQFLVLNSNCSVKKEFMSSWKGFEEKGCKTSYYLQGFLFVMFNEYRFIDMPSNVFDGIDMIFKKCLFEFQDKEFMQT